MICLMNRQKTKTEKIQSGLRSRNDNVFKVEVKASQKSVIKKGTTANETNTSDKYLWQDMARSLLLTVIIFGLIYVLYRYL
jgi:hypothetical protein